LKQTIAFNDAIFDEKDEERARTVVLTSLETLTARHQPSKMITKEVLSDLTAAFPKGPDKERELQRWLNLQAMQPHKFLHEYGKLTGKRSRMSPADLRGCFSYIICDEAHNLKNESAARAVTIAVLSDRTLPNPPKLLLATATGHGGPLPVAGLTQCMDHVVFHRSGGGRRHERL
jgi:hypothetical protein